MENYKLIDLFRTFSKKDFKRLGEFVASPFHNKNERAISLYKILANYFPAFSNRNLTIEKLFAGIFLKQKYDYHKINNVISDLYKVTENFLIINNYINTKNAGDFRILDELRQRKLNRLFKQKYLSFNEQTDFTEFKDEDFWYNKYRLIAEYRIYLFETAPNTELNIMQDEFDNFLKYSLIKLLRFYSIMLHENFQNNVDYNLRMYEEVFSFLEKNSIEEPPILSVYKNVIYLLIKRERKYYDELIRLKNIYINEFSADDKYFLFVHLWGFIAYNIMIVGDYSYYEEAFSHNDETLKLGIRNADNITYFDFLNYVKTACTVGKFDWAEEFIEQYKSAIPPGELENTLNFSYGTIEQKKGNPEKALTYFARTNFSSFILKEQVKIIQCRLFFELKMYDQALSAIDSFRHYLQREKLITNEQRDSIIPFLKYLGQLIRIREMDDKKDADVELGVLKNEVSQMRLNSFGVKLWLLDMIGLGRE